MEKFLDTLESLPDRWKTAGSYHSVSFRKAEEETVIRNP